MEKQQKEGEHFGLTKVVYQPEFNTTGTYGCGPWSVNRQEQEPWSNSLIFEALIGQQIVSTPCQL